MGDENTQLYVKIFPYSCKILIYRTIEWLASLKCGVFWFDFLLPISRLSNVKNFIGKIRAALPKSIFFGTHPLESELLLFFSVAVWYFRILLTRFLRFAMVRLQWTACIMIEGSAEEARKIESWESGLPARRKISRSFGGDVIGGRTRKSQMTDSSFAVRRRQFTRCVGIAPTLCNAATLVRSSADLWCSSVHEISEV